MLHPQPRFTKWYARLNKTAFFSQIKKSCWREAEISLLKKIGNLPFKVNDSYVKKLLHAQALA